MANDIIDINVSETVDSVSITVNPNLTTVNINQVTGGLNQTLQSVTDLGSTTSNSITANSFIKSGGTGANVLLDNGSTTALTSIVGTTNLTYTSGVSNGIVNSNTGTDATIPLADSTNAGLFSATEKTKLSGIASGAEVNVNADWNATSGDAQILNKPTGLATTTYVDNKDNSQQLQLNYLDRDNSIFDAFYLRTIADNGTVEASNQLLSSLAVLRNISYVNQGYTQQINADKFVKLGGAADEFLMADGSISYGGGGGGATNLAYTASPTNGIVTSNTGTDATLPLADGTNAGLLTAAEKTKIANSVPYTGAVSDVNLGEFGIQLGNLEFDNTPTNIPTAAGSMYYNDTDGTLDLKLKGGNVTLQIGQEQVVRVVNKTATNITLLEANYQAVRITGAQGQRMKVDLAQATTDVLSSETIGLVTETIANNQEGFVTTSGIVRGINTTGSLQSETWLDGDILYLSPTVAGQITKVKPTAPNHLIIIGYVIYAHITQGTIFVKVDNGYELDELHNVKITSAANNNVLAYTSATDIWENKSMGLQEVTNINASTTNPIGVSGVGASNAITGQSSSGKGIFGISDTGIGVEGDSVSGIGVKGYSETGIAGEFEIDSISSNIANFKNNGTLKAAIQNDGKITATAGTVSTDVVVKSQLDGKQPLNANLTGLSALSHSGGVPFVRMYAPNLFSLDTNTYLTSVGIANLTATGTPSATTYLRGDNTWATVVSGATNLTYTPSPTNGIVVSSTGDDATLPLADATNAGLLKPAKFTVLENTSGTNTGDQDLSNLVVKNTAITGATNTKITYDAKGLVTAGTTLIESDIPTLSQSKVTNLTTDLAGKQATLQSTVNIKSINGNSLLGSGDLTVSASTPSQSAFTILANNTNASAVPTEQVFENITNATYDGATPTWTGTTAPSAATQHTYSLSQVGNMVTLIINLSYATAGSNLTGVTFELPSTAPTPALPTSVTSANEIINYGSGMIAVAKTIPTTIAPFCALRRNSTNTGNEIVIIRAAAAYRYAYATIQYFV